MGIKVNLKIFIFLGIFYLTGQIHIYGILMLFAFLHELGHLLAGVLLGFKPKSLTIMPYGVSICFGVFPKEYNKKIKCSNQLAIKKLVISLAGPLTNFLMAIAFIMMQGPILGIQREILVYANILIGAFNLLPIYPLDGGRVLKNILNLLYGLKEAKVHTNEISNLTMIILTMIGSIAVYYYQNIAILFMIVYLWSLVIWENRKFHYQMKLYEAIDKQKKAEEKIQAKVKG